MSARILYISYDGMLEPLGQSQVIAYLEGLSDEFEIDLISFEKPADWADRLERKTVNERLERARIRWHPLRYHKMPRTLSTAFDIAIGILVGFYVILRRNVTIVHARSYVPALMALLLKAMTGVRFIFDMRGFWADERVDGGIWQPGARMFRLTKSLERRFLKGADHIVTLTHAAVAEMKTFPYLRDGMPPVTVIPTCADLERFTPVASSKTPFFLGYVGAAGTWYLFEVLVRTFVRLRQMRPEARLLIVNRGEHAYIRSQLLTGGVPESAYELIACTHAEMPRQMARMTATAFFIKPVYSKLASSPTKLGELLGCGIPCLTNAGVGDMRRIVEDERVGVAIERFDDSTLQSALVELLALVADCDISARCVEAARKHFSLKTGVERYRAIYRTLAKASA